MVSEVLPQDRLRAARLRTGKLDILTKVLEMTRDEDALTGIGAAQRLLRTGDDQLID